MNVVHVATSLMSGSRFARLVPLLLAVFSLCSMTNRADADVVYPSGIQSSSIIRGIYPGKDAGSCCWIAGSARIVLTVPSGADALVLTIFVPTYALSGAQTQSLTAQIGSSSKQTVCCLGPGIHELAFALPKHHGPSAAMTVQMSSTFVPARIGLGSDRRYLSVLLRGVAWRNTVGPALTSTLDPRIARALLALYAILFLGAAAATYRRPILGSALLIVTSPFALDIPIDGTTLTLPKVVLIAVALGLMLRRPPLALFRDRRMAALLCAQALLALTILASLHSATFQIPVWREFLKEIQYGLTGLMAFVAFREEASQDREEWIRIALLVTTAVVSMAALLQERMGAPMGLYLAAHSLSRIAGPLEGPNQLGAFLAIALPVIFAVALTRQRSQVDLAVLALGCLAALLTFSRGGVTALLIALALIYFAVRANRFKRIAYAVFTLLFAGAFLLAVLQFAGVGSANLGRIAFGAPAGSPDFNGGLGTRAQLWRGAYVLWRTHPWLGVGAGNYELKVAQTGAPGVRTHANSAYFQTLAEEGMLGFFALALLAATTIRIFAGSTSALALAMLAVVLALWFHQITDYVTFYPKVGVLLWALFGVAVAVSSPNARRQSPNDLIGE